ncbi:hypothetical protein ACFX2I_000222 [Malus domestica]
MAPTSIQGALNMGFQMAITIGILMAGLVNYATAKIEGGYGWRLFLALAAVPSLLMTLAALFLPDTPNSILERGRPDETKEMLQKNPWHQRRGRRFTGIKVIMFYAPLLFNTLGFGEEASLMSTVITGGVNVIATLVSMLTVDRFGRRALFLEGGLQMIISQVAVGIMIGGKFGVSGEGSLTKDEANLLLCLICTYVAAFAWSWGPLGWLVPSEAKKGDIK